MSDDGDDMTPIDLSTWQPAAPKASKRRSAPPPPEGETTNLEKLRTAAESEKLKGKSVEELAEMAVRKAANIYLLGGDAMLSTTATEASNVAKTWASVAALDKARRGGGLTEVDDAAKIAREGLRVLRERAKEKKR